MYFSLKCLGINDMLKTYKSKPIFNSITRVYLYTLK